MLFSLSVNTGSSHKHTHEQYCIIFTFCIIYVVFDLNIVARIMVLIIFNDQLIRSPIACCCAYKKPLIKSWIALHGIHVVTLTTHMCHHSYAHKPHII